MATIPQARGQPVLTSHPPFKVMLPYDPRILLLDYEPFLPVCFLLPSTSESGSAAESENLQGD